MSSRPGYAAEYSTRHDGVNITVLSLPDSFTMELATSCWTPTRRSERQSPTSSVRSRAWARPARRSRHSGMRACASRPGFATGIPRSSSRLPHRRRCARCTTHAMRVPMPMAGGDIGGVPMEPRNCETVNAVIGSPASRTPIRAILVGSSISRTSRPLQATVGGTRPHEVHHPERERRYCRAVQCAVDVEALPHAIRCAAWRVGNLVRV
jgi:hypothetical protein